MTACFDLKLVVLNVTFRTVVVTFHYLSIFQCDILLKLISLNVTFRTVGVTFHYLLIFQCDILLFRSDIASLIHGIGRDMPCWRCHIAV
jgi:hypothetical protein